MEDTRPIASEQLLASAVQYLIEGNETDSAELLLFCSVEKIDEYQSPYNSPGSRNVDLSLRGPRIACEAIDDGFSSVSGQVSQAFSAVLPFNVYLGSISTRATVHVPDENWRHHLHELIKGKGVSNQASGAESSHIWQGFKFRSATEIKIAKALDRAGVLFFPLPKARVAPADRRRMNVEPDFLVCDEGRWGILEVDGEPFHPPERSAMEHERDRIFKRHGVGFVERFDAKKYYGRPDETVEEFRLLMVRAYRRP